MSIMKKQNSLTFIDLFSGAGGLLRGFIDVGYNPVFSVEMWEPAIATHKINYPSVKIIESDIRNISNDSLNKYCDNVDVIVGDLRAKGFQLLEKE